MTTTDLTTGVRWRDSVAVLDLRGDVDARAEESLDHAWSAATGSDPSAVVLNFESAGYINSTGIALIVRLLARARALHMPVAAFGLSPHYREIFEVTRLADFLPINPDEDSALRSTERSTT